MSFFVGPNFAGSYSRPQFSAQQPPKLPAITKPSEPPRDTKGRIINFGPKGAATPH